MEQPHIRGYAAWRQSLPVCPAPRPPGHVGVVRPGRNVSLEDRRSRSMIAVRVAEASSWTVRVRTPPHKKQLSCLPCIDDVWEQVAFAALAGAGLAAILMAL